MPSRNISATACRHAVTARPLPWNSGLKTQCAVPSQGLRRSNVINPPNSPSIDTAHVFIRSHLAAIEATKSSSVCGLKSSDTRFLNVSVQPQTLGRLANGNGLDASTVTMVYRRFRGRY